MIKYQAWAGFPIPIQKVEVVRETANSVYLPCGESWANGGRREAKRSTDRGYFDTFQEAREFLLMIEEEKIATLAREIARRQASIEKIKEMRE